MTPPLTVDEALAAYAVVVADVIHLRRAAEQTARVVQDARRADDLADKAHQDALKRLSAAADAVDRAQQQAIDGTTAEPEPVPVAAYIDEDDVHAYEYAWMNGAIP